MSASTEKTRARFDRQFSPTIAIGVTDLPDLLRLAGLKQVEESIYIQSAQPEHSEILDSTTHQAVVVEEHNILFRLSYDTTQILFVADHDRCSRCDPDRNCGLAPVNIFSVSPNEENPSLFRLLGQMHLHTKSHGLRNIDQLDIPNPNGRHDSSFPVGDSRDSQPTGKEPTVDVKKLRWLINEQIETAQGFNGDFWAGKAEGLQIALEQLDKAVSA